jgi:ATP-dependent Lon protease
VREKVLAAHRIGLRTVILPKRNAKDLVEIPKDVRKEMKISLVEHVDSVLAQALRKEGKPSTVGLGAPKKKAGRPKTIRARKTHA